MHGVSKSSGTSQRKKIACCTKKGFLFFATFSPGRHCFAHSFQAILERVLFRRSINKIKNKPLSFRGKWFIIVTTMPLNVLEKKICFLYRWYECEKISWRFPFHSINSCLSLFVITIVLQVERNPYRKKTLNTITGYFVILTHNSELFFYVRIHGCIKSWTIKIFSIF